MCYVNKIHPRRLARMYKGCGMDVNDDIVEAVNRQIQEPPEIDVSDYDEWKADNKTLLRLNVAVLVVSMLSLIVGIIAIIKT